MILVWNNFNSVVHNIYHTIIIVVNQHVDKYDGFALTFTIAHMRDAEVSVSAQPDKSRVCKGTQPRRPRDCTRFTIFYSAIIRGACIQLPATFKDTHFTFCCVDWTTSLLQILICSTYSKFCRDWYWNWSNDWKIFSSLQSHSGDKQDCCLLHNTQEDQSIHLIFQNIRAIP